MNYFEAVWSVLLIVTSPAMCIIYLMLLGLVAAVYAIAVQRWYQYDTFARTVAAILAIAIILLVVLPLIQVIGSNNAAHPMTWGS